MHAPMKSILWSLFILVMFIRAQQLDPIVNMCVRLHHQSVVKNNTLYIDGGRQTFIDVTGSGSSIRQTGHITEGYNNYLIAIDLSNSWDWKTNISEQALTKSKVPQTGTLPPNVAQAALYHGADSDDNIYLLGGTTSDWNTTFPGYRLPPPAQYSLWSYNISGQSWAQYDITLTSPNRPNSGSATEARDQGLSFYFNGQIDSGSEQASIHLGDDEEAYLQGMLVVDTNNQTARNLSTQAVVGNTPRSRGEMQYIEELGGKGILVQIGGNQKEMGDTNSSSLSDLVPMNQIDVFDVSSLYNASTPDGTWYKQNTTGDTPDGRIDFCLVLASSDDGSSHNIYMYGGRGINGTASVFFDEIWVLSLPSFTWTNIYQGTSPRYGHSCHRVGPRTMLTVGGAENTKLNQTPCDWETKGVGVFDMTAVTWGSVYDANAADYSVPKLVASKIGSVPGRPASMTQPKGGFDLEGLAAIFNTTWTANGTTAAGDGANSTLPFASQPNPQNITGPIVGGVIGALVLTGLLSTLLWYYRQPLKRILLGHDLFPFFELAAGKEKEEAEGAEMAANDAAHCWELSGAEKPVELSSPTTTMTLTNNETDTVREDTTTAEMEMEAAAARKKRMRGENAIELPSPTRKRNVVDTNKPLPIPQLEITSPTSEMSPRERTLHDERNLPVDEESWI